MSPSAMEGVVTTENGPEVPPPLMIGQRSALGHDFTSSVHLYFLHWMWEKILNFDLHPKIPQTGELAVACVNDGTGIWSIDLAKRHPNWRCDTFNTTAEQFPPSVWLPSNCTLSVLDFTKPIPLELRGQYDVVRCPWVSHHCRNGDFMTIVDNCLQFLKPGGYFQWEECDVRNTRAVPVKAEIPTADLELFISKAVGVLSGVAGSDLKWVSELDKHSRSRNLVVLASERYTVPDHLAEPWTLQHLMVAMSMINQFSAMPEKLNEWLDMYDRAALAVMHGGSIRMDTCICVSQVPPGRPSKS